MPSHVNLKTFPPALRKEHQGEADRGGALRAGWGESQSGDLAASARPVLSGKKPVTGCGLDLEAQSDSPRENGEGLQNISKEKMTACFPAFPTMI